MTKISNSSSPDSFFFQAQNAPKSVFGQDPARRAHDAPPDPLVGWGGDTPNLFPSPSTPSAPWFSGPLNTNSWVGQCNSIGYAYNHHKESSKMQARPGRCSLGLCRIILSHRDMPVDSEHVYLTRTRMWCTATNRVTFHTI